MNGFLLDTNTPSELMRSRPDPRIVRWVRVQPDKSLYLSVITIGELRKGFTILPASDRRTRLEEWFDNNLLPLFAGRILPVTRVIADHWGISEGERRRQGRPLNTADGLIAATALEHNLSLVTRNVRDYANLGVALFNPWEASYEHRP